MNVITDDLIKSAEQGDAQSQFQLGENYSKLEKYDEAFKWYERAANQGHAGAQCSISYLYTDEKINNKSKAAEMMIKSAEQGYAPAQRELGYWYTVGFALIEKDYSKAFEWFLKAANQGEAEAMKKLSDCYKYGDGVPKDETKSQEWYEKAIKAGFKPSENEDGVLSDEEIVKMLGELDIK